MMPREFLDKAKEMASKPTGIPVENMCISATHTHSAPAVMGCLGSGRRPGVPAFLQAQSCGRSRRRIRPCSPRKRVGPSRTPRTTRSTPLDPALDKIRNDPFGNPTVRANMHPGYSEPRLHRPQRPGGRRPVAPGAADGRRQAAGVLANFLDALLSVPCIVSSDYFGLFCAGLAKKIAAAK